MKQSLANHIPDHLHAQYEQVTRWVPSPNTEDRHSGKPPERTSSEVAGWSEAKAMTPRTVVSVENYPSGQTLSDGTGKLPKVSIEKHPRGVSFFYEHLGKEVRELKRGIFKTEIKRFPFSKKCPRSMTGRD